MGKNTFLKQIIFGFASNGCPEFASPLCPKLPQNCLKMPQKASKVPQNASKFGGDDSARFDFEEAGKISKPLLNTFFKGNKWVSRADAKRSDSAPNIRSLISKSFGTQLTANRIARAPSVASAIKALPKAAIAILV